MRVLKHGADGFEWEGEGGRRARVVFAGEAAMLTLVGCQKGKEDDVASYKGDRIACSAIALAWVQGLTPGSNAIKWKKGAEPKWPDRLNNRSTRRPKAG